MYTTKNTKRIGHKINALTLSFILRKAVDDIYNKDFNAGCSASTILLLAKSEIVGKQACLSVSWSKILKTDFQVTEAQC